MNQYLAMGRNYRTHDKVETELIYPIFLEKAEEGRKARFHQYLEAHLEEFWPIHKRILPSLSEDEAEYLQNYVDPLRDPDRLWNV